jgi:hypothetical protein
MATALEEDPTVRGLSFKRVGSQQAPEEHQGLRKTESYRLTIPLLHKKVGALQKLGYVFMYYEVSPSIRYYF